MNESDSLNAFAEVLTAVAEKPYDVALHARHIKLAQSQKGMEGEVQSAMEMMIQFLSAPDEVWIPLLTAKEKAVDMDTREGLEELLALYSQAENDYLSIPILRKHLNFLIERHGLYASGENMKPVALEDAFSTSWTRQAISDVVSKGVIHIMQSSNLWDIQRDWELEMLENSTPQERPDLIRHVQEFLLKRLQQPHPNIEETFQTYSTFTTNYLPSQDYESLLIAASKVRGQSIRNLDRRQRLETTIADTAGSLNAYHQAISYERRAKHPDIFVTRGIYERAIAEAAKRQYSEESGAEQALKMFWSSYCDAVRILDLGVEEQLDVYRRAVRSVPSSGEVWSRYIRFLESTENLPEDVERIPDIFDRALEAKLVQTDIDELAPLVLARSGYEKRKAERGDADEDTLPTLIGVLEGGIAMAYDASKQIDPKLRLEKFLIQIYERAGLVDSIFDVWKAAAKHSKSSYQVWMNYTDSLIKHQRYEEARKVFSDIHSKNLDWPEALWEAWLMFEHSHGSVEEIESCLDKIESAQYQTNMRRAKEAAKAYEDTAAYQTSVNLQPNEQAAVTNVPTSTTAAVEAPMEIDEPKEAPAGRGNKRNADDDLPSESHKKARVEQNLPLLKRDRENSTVFIAALPGGASEEDLYNLFKDCGEIREVKLTSLPTSLVATVEFVSRDDVPAALTKDRKRVHGQEISVHLAWQSTLYVTNFPESSDDKFIRDLFGKYGSIFDVRWPSKKFKTTRRFCYVQFTSPADAEASLELHGRELEPNLPLSVYVSNPERKKERTDQDANEKEIYIAGLSRYTNKADLEKVFSTYGPVKDVRMALDDSGHARGFAFVEFENVADAHKSLAANNYELKKRRIAVTLADPRVKAKHRSEIGLSRVAEARSRSVRIRNLPPATQEGLLQQALEKITQVKRVEVFNEKQEAVVELENAADAGRLLLRPEPFIFNGNTLELVEDIPAVSRAAASTEKNEGPALFKPRRLGPSKPKAGLGFKKSGISVISRSSVGQPQMSAAGGTTPASGGKGQDDFRKMLESK